MRVKFQQVKNYLKRRRNVYIDLGNFKMSEAYQLVILDIIKENTRKSKKK